MAKNTKKNALESNKRARAKYNNAHYKTIAARVSTEKAEQIKEFCVKNGLAVNELVKKSIDLFIKNYKK